ncbi:MAG: type IV pilin protein [Proteobacteria bacterium]|nr:type IV pilin protein [Pseudomonadota bacterium]
MHLLSQKKRRQPGFTLLELMVVVAIVSILAALAYPSYMQYVIKTKRTAATSVLLRVADRQQQFFMDNKSYTNNLTNLGFAADPLIVSDEGNSVPAGDPEAVYSVSLSAVTAITFMATAAPMNGQLSRDTKCGSLTLDQAATRGNSAGGDGCW